MSRLKAAQSKMLELAKRAVSTLYVYRADNLASPLAESISEYESAAAEAEKERDEIREKAVSIIAGAMIETYKRAEIRVDNE